MMVSNKDYCHWWLFFQLCFLINRSLYVYTVKLIPIWISQSLWITSDCLFRPFTVNKTKHLSNNICQPLPYYRFTDNHRASHWLSLFFIIQNWIFGFFLLNKSNPLKKLSHGDYLFWCHDSTSDLDHKEDWESSLQGNNSSKDNNLPTNRQQTQSSHVLTMCG